ncbi:Peptide/opine/nickel uptake family ABC transporter, periplasmic substrate-binding protein [Rhodovulum sp. P5]|uniref:peptide ABC transporter substrate-binding protein n=1 Tax=Rhodovulum sp. P5 TaxID=1564506 RepID=UPI0009C36A65|nr:peptide ABC transporter substrate-binding protein [Rhodovulum sp. P5]ARE41600.1 Peptide/opine/nickel uptake family ABC transporter, periplasmic substrate-binding protein [Rhodovulum sp. P5]
MKLRHALLGAAAVTALAPAAFAERGSDGQVNIIYWQAPSTMNPYLSGGTKELEAASLVLEPLARYDQDGNMVPFLAESIPTVENGGVSADLKTVTWKLKPGLKWADGSPVTSADVKFSWQYCTAEGGGCAQSEKYNDVADVETPDELTAIVHFSVAKPFPYGPFVGAQAPIIQAAQFADCLGAKAPECTDANFMPQGTGPFTVTDFRPNDVIQMKANPNYRDPAKPAFATVTFKGGGDAMAAGRSVLETGEFDYAWNLQLAPDVLANMAGAGKGQIVSGFGTLVERIMINFTDPAPSHGDRRSTVDHPHPFLTDMAVRKALSMAIDRELLTEIGYGEAGRATCNVLPAPEIYRSTANDACLVQDIEGAKKLLDEAGWVPGADGVRVKDGMRLSILYQTSTNAVRQDFQALIKQWWSEIGVETELRNIDASVFFGGDPGSPDTFQKFYADVEMYANNFDGTDPESYMANWLCKEIPSPETQWQGNNINRYCTEAYDALVAEMATTGELEKRAELAKAMNDMLMQDYALLPLVDRGRVSAHSNSLGGVILNTWDSELWNAADWYRIK